MVSTEYVMGFAVGLLMVVIIIAILLKFNKNSMKGKFDERQELVRGRGYKYSTFTLLILIALDMLADEAGVFEHIYVANSVILFGILLTGVMVYALYCIRNDAYFGVGQDTRGYRIFMWGVIVLNAISGITGIRNGAPEGGKLSSNSCIQILFCIAFTLILIALYVRNAEDKKRSADEDALDESSEAEM